MKTGVLLRIDSRELIRANRPDLRCESPGHLSHGIFLHNDYLVALALFSRVLLSPPFSYKSERVQSVKNALVPLHSSVLISQQTSGRFYSFVKSAVSLSRLASQNILQGLIIDPEVLQSRFRLNLLFWPSDF